MNNPCTKCSHNRPCYITLLRSEKFDRCGAPFLDELNLFSSERKHEKPLYCDLERSFPVPIGLCGEEGRFFKKATKKEQFLHHLLGILFGFTLFNYE